MSLINQALHKAQRDRTPNRMAEPGSGEFSTAAPASGSGMKPGLVIGLVVAVALLLGLVAGLSVVLLKGNDAAPLARQTPPAAEDNAPAQENASTPPSEPAATTSNNLELIAPPVEPPTTSSALDREATTPVVEELRKAREAAEAKAAAEAEAAQAEAEAKAKAAEAEAKAAEEAAARAAAEPNQEIIDWLSRAQITGVKISTTESKVILNGKSYAVGEYANYNLGLKVMIIQEERILFVDANGKKYMKRL